MIRASKFVAALLLAIGSFGFVGAVKAQTGPSGPIAPVVGPTTTTQTAPATIGISDADVLNLVRSLDQNAKVTQIKDGGVEYRFTIARDGWQYQLRMTTFHNEIWIDAALGDPTGNIQKVPVEALSQLMLENYKVGPSHFSFAKNTDGRIQLYLGRNLERALFNADRLRGTIDTFCKHVKDTYPAWSAYTNAAK